MNDIILSPLQGSEKEFVLKKEFKRSITIEGKLYEIIVPENFITDLASTPRFLWIFMPPWGKYGPASIIHDYLYETRTLPRIKCEKIFHKMMKEDGVSFWRRLFLYTGVYVLGWWMYYDIDKKVKSWIK